MSEKKINKLEIDLYFLNGYVTRYIDSYKIAASLYNMILKEHNDVDLKVDFKQFDGDYILREIKEIVPKNHHYVFIVSGLPMIDSSGSRIFGIVDPKERVAVLSEDRLVSDPKLAKERIMKEAAHLIGHFWGLGHCLNQTCIMSYAKSLKDVDNKLPMLCKSCQEDFKKAYNEMIK
ncbi:MAG: hypothetical protein ACP5LF_01075 [Nitrososphaeria archaeon]|nr:hypothetical protein [Conexivisphaerales archaeon]